MRLKKAWKADPNDTINMVGRFSLHGLFVMNRIHEIRIFFPSCINNVFSEIVFIYYTSSCGLGDIFIPVESILTAESTP